MARCICIAVVITRVALLASGHQLRQTPSDIPEANPAVHDTTRDTAASKISVFRVKANLAANTAQSAAAQAATQKLKAEEIYVKTKNIMPELEAVMAVAKDQAKSAQEAGAESSKGMTSIEKSVKRIKNDAKLLAVEGVKKMMKDQYNNLSAWRHGVLNNPWAKGQVAATKAAAPYFQMMGKFGGTVAAYNLEASTMSSQSAADAANAKSLAAGVKAKEDAGDKIGAYSDQTMADALKVQSAQLAARAGSLAGQAADMTNTMPQYANGAHMAAWAAEFAANPDGVPPPPVDPNFAYAGPR